MGVIDLDIQGHLATISTQELYSTLLLFTDLGRPRGATRPKRALVIMGCASRLGQSRGMNGQERGSGLFSCVHSQM